MNLNVKKLHIFELFEHSDGYNIVTRMFMIVRESTMKDSGCLRARPFRFGCQAAFRTDVKLQSESTLKFIRMPEQVRSLSKSTENFIKRMPSKRMRRLLQNYKEKYPGCVKYTRDFNSPENYYLLNILSDSNYLMLYFEQRNMDIRSFNKKLLL